jgi:hypothetical protein
MRMGTHHTSGRSIFIAIALISCSLTGLNAQKNENDIRFGVFADPLISWFSSDNRVTSSEGSRAGFNFGMTVNKYFSKNYSFSTGISILNAGGRLSNTDSIQMEFNSFKTWVKPGESVTYHIQYIDIPLGLKFESNQIGYITFFTDLGLDPKFVIGGKIDIPSEGIDGESASKEINSFNMSYHLMTGIAYSLGGNTALVFGIGYENNFIDVTKEVNGQPPDRIRQNIIRFRLGVNF